MFAADDGHASEHIRGWPSTAGSARLYAASNQSAARIDDVVAERKSAVIRRLCARREHGWPLQVLWRLEDNGGCDQEPADQAATATCRCCYERRYGDA